ncbi:MAG: hypothetical protein LV479_00120 [Methylacidiphilales bacterium]|nr:hypothetical protein [Candidatus Methylacidiphilales bacterium]
MGQDAEDVADASIIMDRRKDAVFVAAHIKDDDRVPFVGCSRVSMIKRFSEFSEVKPFGSTYNFVPLFQ